MTGQPDDQPTSMPGGTVVEPPPPEGQPLPAGRHLLTARDAYPFIRKEIG